MLPAIKSELRKVLTIRSTYLFLAIVVALTVLLAGFVTGFRAKAAALDTHMYQNMLLNVNALSILTAFVGLLLVGHEYRHNTIIYTLASARSRLKVLCAKTIVISVFALLAGGFIALFSILCLKVGATLGGHTLPPQHLNWLSTLGRSIFSAWGYAMYALILALILRNQVGAIAAFLVIPSIGESLLMGLLQEKRVYLPFTALGNVVSNNGITSTMSVAGSMAVVLYYVVGGLLVAGILFRRRDAN